MSCPFFHKTNSLGIHPYTHPVWLVSQKYAVEDRVKSGENPILHIFLNLHMYSHMSVNLCTFMLSSVHSGSFHYIFIHFPTFSYIYIHLHIFLYSSIHFLHFFICPFIPCKSFHICPFPNMYIPIFPYNNR